MQVKDKDRLKILGFIKQRAIDVKRCSLCRGRGVLDRYIVLQKTEHLNCLKKETKIKSDELIRQCLQEFVNSKYVMLDVWGDIHLTENGENYYQKLYDRLENNKRNFRSGLIAFITSLLTAMITSPLIEWLVEWLKKPK